jgi:nitrate reductase NapAB chaperone NapD
MRDKGKDCEDDPMETEMILASGFLETNDPTDNEKVIQTLRERAVEVNGVKDEKIVFLIERETASEVKPVLDSLKDIEGVRNVYLTYYSIEEQQETP